VRVSKTEVVILEQVQFDTGKSTIKPESNALLDEVAQVLNQHPEMTKIEVQGHTDNRGSAALNKSLSQARAEAVRKAMIQRGVVAERLSAKGYGPDKPIDDNTTDAGRQRNRRVQFLIVDQQPKETL
jgi:outer membrane protein OmpA-like peptidoglycan-associated protein